MRLDENSADELAAQLMISPHAIKESARRGLLIFKKHRGVVCWRFGDASNGCLRRLDGQPFAINGQCVKAESETRGQEWHRLIGLDDVLANDRREILMPIEGSKDALAALHFADAEAKLSQIGVVAALGAGVKPLPDDVEKFRGRRVRIFGDADPAGQETVSSVGELLLPVAEEVQIFNLSNLYCDEGSLVKDLFDLSRIAYEDFESNRDLWCLTDLDSKGERVNVLTKKHEFFLSSPSPPHVSPESHGFPVYPVSSVHDLEKELVELARRHACCTSGTARKQRWKLLRDVAALEKRIFRKLTPTEHMKTVEIWYSTSKPYLDPKKARDDYVTAYFSEVGKVRVPKGEGEALNRALDRILSVPLVDLPELVDAPESWRKVATLHRELARQSANGTYFLGCRDAAKADHSLNKDSANNINHALAQLGVIVPLRVGDARPGGKASEFRYLLSV
jgi:hypothetical protein